MVVVLAPGADPAWAQTEEQQRAAAATKRAQSAARLNALKADDTQLETAVAALNQGVAAQDKTATAASQALRAAEGSVGAAERRLAETEARMVGLRKEVSAAALRAYVHPSGGGLLTLVSSRSLEEATRRRTLLASVIETDSSIIEQLRGAREDQQSEQANVRRARDLAAARRTEAAGRLDELKRLRSDQMRLKRALDSRIAGVAAEVEALAREEARLAALIRARAAPAAPGSRPSASGFVFPTSGTITSRFGMRWGRLHAGIDIASGAGTPIKASKDGRVILAGFNGGYGNAIVVDHGGGVTTLYAHMSRLRVSDGASVRAGQHIGDMGSTGSSTGNHLHFEVRVGGTAQNPQRYV
ncbi:MAG: murein hydrolase activator EnvC family protein [Acidimicrobiales bacterium]